MTLQSVLGVFAHPDDETIMAGGTLACLGARGLTTHVASATRGEGGEAGQPPVVTDRCKLGPAREAELRCALEALGVSGLTLLGYVDPDIGPDDTLGPFEADDEVLVRQIADVIRATRAEVVLTHGPDGEYGHPAHRLTHRAVYEAVSRCTPDVLLYSIMARPPQSVPGHDDRLWNASRPAHLVLDVTPWAEAKIAAMECHVSQHALFKRRRNLQTVREALRATETFHREWPATNGVPPADDFAALLVAAGAVAVTGS